MTESRNRADSFKGRGGSSRIPAFQSLSLAISIRLTRALLLRKIRQGIRKMYLAPTRGFFYARLGKN